MGGAITALMLTEEGVVKIQSSSKETFGLKTPFGKWVSIPLPSDVKVTGLRAAQNEVRLPVGVSITIKHLFAVKLIH